jgi:hypothetical protein
MVVDFIFTINIFCVAKVNQNSQVLFAFYLNISKFIVLAVTYNDLEQ